VVGVLIFGKTIQILNENTRLEAEHEKMERILEMTSDANKQLKMENQLLKGHLMTQAERIDALENKLYFADKLCFMCEEREVNTSLEPCGHGMCGMCARKVDDCPKCCSRISRLHPRF